MQRITRSTDARTARRLRRAEVAEAQQQQQQGRGQGADAPAGGGAGNAAGAPAPGGGAPNAPHLPFVSAAAHAAYRADRFYDNNGGAQDAPTRAARKALSDAVWSEVDALVYTFDEALEAAATNSASFLRLVRHIDANAPAVPRIEWKPGMAPTRLRHLLVPLPADSPDRVRILLYRTLNRCINARVRARWAANLSAPRFARFEHHSDRGAWHRAAFVWVEAQGIALAAAALVGVIGTFDP